MDAPASVTVRLALRSGFGADGMRDLRRDEDGRWHGRLGDGSLSWASSRGSPTPAITASATPSIGSGHSWVRTESRIWSIGPRALERLTAPLYPSRDG